ncbi:MAG: hypothetical protein ACK4FP_14355, partial [Azonexus sp.]
WRQTHRRAACWAVTSGAMRLRSPPSRPRAKRNLQKERYTTASLPDLAAKMQLMSATECHVPYERLRKWSAGMDLMAVSVAKALSNASRRHNWHWTSFFLARALTFVIDFLMAAAPGAKPKRQSIQAIVADRFVGLGQNLRIAMAKRAKASNEKPIQTAT